MKTVNLIQGNPEWHAHRAQHWNASDAPAMLGISPYKSRAELLREKATGISPEIDAATQRRFDDGHRFEHLARNIAETIIGEDLYPVTGTEGRYSASFDGLTMLEDTAFEHKTASQSLIAAIEDANENGVPLPEHYRVQMEQQCMVSGAARVLFMASKWTDDGELIEERHCWYYPDPDLRARIIAGWEQFERDLADYKPEAVETKPVGRSPETLPALRIEARGMVTASNMAEFREHAMAVLGEINRDLQTDDDFANAESTVKWCSGVEERLAAAKANVLAQMADVDAVCRTIDDVSAETRRIRLELDKLVKAEKENRKAQIVRDAVEAVRAHYASINARLGAHAIGIPASMTVDIGASIKGLKTLASMRDKVDSAVANAKIDASQIAVRVCDCIAILDEHADYLHLFPDRVTLCATKSPEDLRNLIATRIAEHKAREAAKLEAERERIRAEESARIERERAAEELAAAKQSKEGAELSPAAQAIYQQEGAQRFADHHRVQSFIPAKTIKLGEINAAIAPLSITAEGLASIGFASCGQDRAAKLYRADDLPEILRTLAHRLNMAAQSGVAA
jgi:putative phage-type endonuclease